MTVYLDDDLIKNKVEDFDLINFSFMAQTGAQVVTMSMFMSDCLSRTNHQSSKQTSNNQSPCSQSQSDSQQIVTVSQF